MSTDTDCNQVAYYTTHPFDVVPLGGRHRRPVVAVSACAEVRRRLAVAVEAAAVAQ